MLVLLAVLVSVARACECIPRVALHAPVTVAEEDARVRVAFGPKPLVFVDTIDQPQVRVVMTAAGREVPIRVQPWGAHTLRVTSRVALPVGTLVTVRATGDAPPVPSEALLEGRIHEEPPLPAGGVPTTVGRSRTSNFCGTRDELSVGGTEAGLYAVWFTARPKGTFDRGAPAVVARANGEIALENCWGGKVPLPTGELRMSLRRIGPSGELGPPVVLDVPAEPEPDGTGMN